jgi:hypothetical protein
MAITIPILTDFNGRGIDRGIKQFQRLETKGQKAGFLIRKAALPAALALGAIGLAAKAGLDGVMADDEALANLQSTITSTGNAANITSESFFAYANQLQKVTAPGPTRSPRAPRCSPPSKMFATKRARVIRFSTERRKPRLTCQKGVRRSFRV